MPEISTTVVEVRPETHDATTLKLDLGGVTFPHRPGQYVEIDPHQFEALAAGVAEMERNKGMPESPRSFSISSDGSDSGFIEISVKEEKPRAFDPVVTPFLVHGAKPGLRIVLSGPNGRYCLPESPPPVHGFLHLCAGSGVAPNRGMILFALGRGWPQRHLLLLQNRTESDVFYRSEWPELLARYGDRLRVRHVFSVTAKERVSPELVRKEMEGFIEGASSLALVCGPNRPREIVAPDGTKKKEPGFCEQWCGNPRRRTAGLLESLGFAPDRILTEMW